MIQDTRPNSKFFRRYPYIDKSAGADIGNWISILHRMHSCFDKDTLFIFGHTREGYDVIGSKDDLAAFAGYLTALLNFVVMEIKNGRSNDQILKATAIPGDPDWKGEGIERSLKVALVELS